MLSCRKARLFRAVIDSLEPRRLLTNTALHINAGGGVTTDALARTFSSSVGLFTGGRDEPSSVTDIDGTADDALFSSRYIGAHFTAHAAIASGHYTLFVEFAEPTATAAGQRVFDLSAEGSLVADDLDVFANAGKSAFAVAKDVTITDGALDLSFDASVGEAFVNEIVLVPTDVPAVAQPYDQTRNTADANNSVLAASRLARIGGSITLYSNENRGKFPATLVQLVAGEDLPIEALTNPRAVTRTPRGVLSLIERSAYASTLNDFVYIGSGLRNSGTASAPVAYENPTRAAGDLNVLYLDGHVAKLTRASAATSLGFANVPPTTSATLTPLAVDTPTLQSQLNLQGIAQALEYYENEQHGRYPPDIGSLAGDTNSLTIFSNPRLGTAAAPPIPAGATYEERVAWVNAHSDYTLAAFGVRDSFLSASDVAIFEKPSGLTDGTSGGLNVALGDGSVVFREARWALESITAAAKPVLLNAVFYYDTTQLWLKLDNTVTTSSLASIVATNITTGQTFAQTGINFDAATHVALINFTTATKPVLPDGNYTVSLAGIRDAAGNALVADPLYGSLNASFFILGGDLNRDRIVNFDDLVILAQNYGTKGKSLYDGNADHDAAGNVNFDDLVVLAQRYNKTLPAPAAFLAAPVEEKSTARKSVITQVMS